MQITHNTYIAGTEGDGIALIEQKEKNSNYEIMNSPVNAHSFFKDNLIRCFYLDKSKCLWIGSGHSGLAIANLNSKPFYTLDMPTKDTQSFVRSLCKDSQDRLWIGIKLGGVYFLKDNRYTELPIDKKQNFNAIYEDNDRNIWICTNRNIYIYRNEKLHTITDLAGIPKNIHNHIKAASTIIQDKYGHIWIGGTGHLLVLKDVFKNTFQFKLINEPWTQDLYCMQKDVNGRLWFGSRSYGLFILNINNKCEVIGYQSITTKNSTLKSDKIWHISLNKKQKKVYIATDSGLDEFDLLKSRITGKEFPAKIAHNKS